MTSEALKRVLIAFLFVLPGCTHDHTTPAVPPSSVPPTGSRTIPSHLVTTRLVLSEHVVRAGRSISGTIVIDNNTSMPMNVIDCGSIFQVLLVNASYHPNPVWPLCAQPITIPVGDSQYQVSILATYNSCSQTRSAVGGPVCQPGGSLPPLPAGSYEATAFEMGTSVPVPPAVSVVVTR